MDRPLSRQEIRRSALAVVGQTTDGVLGAMQRQQVNALIDQAAVWVAERSRWISTRRSAVLSTGIAADLIGYSDIELARWLAETYPTQYLPATYGTPADPFTPDLSAARLAYISSGCIDRVALWDQAGQYYRELRKAIIPVEASTDRDEKLAAEAGLQEAFDGGSTDDVNDAIASATAQAESRRTAPVQVECQHNGIRLWPIPDQRYVYRIQYTIPAGWEFHQQSGISAAEIDALPSVCDGEAIKLKLCADLYAQEGDDFQERRYTMKAEERIAGLRGRQASGQDIATDRACTFDEDDDVPSAPRWDLRPIVR